MSEVVRRGDSRIARFAAATDRTAGRRVVGPYEAERFARVNAGATCGRPLVRRLQMSAGGRRPPLRWVRCEFAGVRRENRRGLRGRMISAPTMSNRARCVPRHQDNGLPHQCAHWFAMTSERYTRTGIPHSSFLICQWRAQATRPTGMQQYLCGPPGRRPLRMRGMVRRAQATRPTVGAAGKGFDFAARFAYSGGVPRCGRGTQFSEKGAVKPWSRR